MWQFAYFFTVSLILWQNVAKTQAMASDDMDNMKPISSEDIIDFDSLMPMCNSSFRIPLAYVEEFHNTGQLSDITDKTGMCYIRCMWEKSGLIDNWKLNANKIRANIWPATGDTLDVCENIEANEKNDCVRAYEIAKCLMQRAIVDAQNKPTV